MGIRDSLLILSLLGCVGMTLRYPFAGILTWTWLACMTPHQELYGLSQTAPVNLIIAVVTIFAWLFSKERKLPPVDGTLVAVLALLAWMTFNAVFAADPSSSWPLWDRTWRIIALGIFVGMMATNQVRIYALIWVASISLLYYGVKGGLLTFLSGGTKLITGPANTGLEDNNLLAVALLMTLPLVNYLRLHTANRWLRLGLNTAGFLTFVSVLGSYSRGGYVTLAALGGVSWLKSRKKIYFLIAGLIALVPMLYFMPQSFYDRVNTLSSPGEDASFMGRVTAWQVAFYYAVDHFPFGAGFHGIELPRVYHYYFPADIPHAAHSIYFQMLGEHGFFGLALYLVILVLAFVNCSRIRKATRGKPELTWAYDLATMIQLSLIAFSVGGAALSIAFNDLFIVWVGVLPCLRNLVIQTQSKRAKVWPASGPIDVLPEYRRGQPVPAHARGISAHFGSAP